MTSSDNLTVLWQEVFNALSASVKDAGEFGAKAARETTKFKNNGPLRDATNFHSLDDYSGFVLADKPYAQYLEEGNPAEGAIIHGKPILHFQINGEDVFVRSVKAHGGYHFMADAEAKTEAEIERIFDKRLNGIK